MDIDSESRQGVLATARANLVAANYTLAVAKAKRYSEEPQDQRTS